MKNIIKIAIVMLTSISLFGSAYAGTLGVSGTAKATYNIKGGDRRTLVRIRYNKRIELYCFR